MSSSCRWNAAPQQEAAATILHNELCAFWGVGSVRFAHTTLNLGLTSYLRHIRPHYHSHTAARSLLMFVPHGSVGVMACFVPPSLIGQCYSKLLMWSGCFDVVFTSWYLCPLGHADIWILFCRLHCPKNNNFIKHLIRNALHFHIFLPE